MSSNLPVENAKKATMKRMSSGPLAVAKFLIETFSTVRQRQPPSKDKTCHVRLITIGVSHFCEKARFVLDLAEADENSPYYYTEDAHPPGFQAYETLKASNHEASMTPMAVYEENGESKLIYESARILKHFMPELYPKEIQSQVEEVEADLGKRFGAPLRCFAYYYLLSDAKKNHKTLLKMCADPAKVATIESTVFDKFLEKGLAAGIKRSLGVDQASFEASVKELRELFAEWSGRLEDSGGEYLLDTKQKTYGFTAADLTFAALAYPLLRPAELAAWLVEMEELPPEINAMTRELRATKAGQHALKIYAKHRLRDGSKFVSMKYMDRTKYVLPSWQTMGVASVAAMAIALGASLSWRKFFVK